MKLKTNRPDYILIAAVAVLLVIGLIMLSSASSVLATQQFNNPYFYLKRQFFIGVIGGGSLCFLISLIPYQFWRAIAFPLLFFTLILLALVFVPGIGVAYGGSHRWIKTGLFDFQPTELAKLVLIFYFSAWLSAKGTKVATFKEGLLPFTVIIGIISALIIFQPDVGTLGMLIIIALSIFFVSGASLKHIFLLLAGLALGLWGIIKAAPYRMNRFLVFLNPRLDPKGIGYQINQALLAIGSGGIFGLGLGYSRQKFNYLPEPMGDSIFAIISEELGLAGACVILAIFAVVAWRGWKIAKKAPDKFGQLAAVGITSWIIFQVIINIAAITSLMPLTGITLPFISYGSSSMIMMLAAVGVLINISKQGNGC
ncbi:MAG: putative lipid II flippase FtsW [bacterium]